MARGPRVSLWLSFDAVVRWTVLVSALSARNRSALVPASRSAFTVIRCAPGAPWVTAPAQRILPTVLTRSSSISQSSAKISRTAPIPTPLLALYHHRKTGPVGSFYPDQEPRDHLLAPHDHSITSPAVKPRVCSLQPLRFCRDIHAHSG